MLYPEFLRDIDTTEVKLRKRHKTFVRMYRRGNSSTSSGEEESETTSERLERQDAVEYSTSGNESRVYSDIDCKTGRKESWDGTIYESFIDHGEDAGEVRYQRLRNNDSVNTFCFVTECESPTRESFMIGSTPVRYVESKRHEPDDNVMHLSTAKITLLDIKQRSEQSQTSSFEHKLSGGGWKNMACEDLLNIDDSKVRNVKKEKPFEEKHHSMPVQFVGNRFNESSLTEIYIPSCKSQNENIKNHLATPCNSFEDEEAHSNSVQIHRGNLTIEAPDQLTAEILYNIEKLTESSTRAPSPCGDRMSIDKGNSVIQPNPEPERHDSKCMLPVTIYSSDSDSGMAGSYTLSPSDPLGQHRSFTSHKFNPHVTPSSIDFYAQTTNIDSLNQDFSGLRAEMSSALHHKDESLEGENRSNVFINFESCIKNSSTGESVYYSGMYAHWWKKEKLPIEIMEAIADHSGKCESQERGSGKKPLKNHFNDVALSCFFNCNLILDDD